MKASVAHIRREYASTERRACRLLPVPVSSHLYEPRQNDNSLRERPAMKVDTSFAGLCMARVLDQIIAERGLPRSIRCDNGPELTSRHVLAWALDRKIDLVYIQPDKPTQKAHVESFNSKLCEE